MALHLALWMTFAMLRLVTAAAPTCDLAPAGGAVVALEVAPPADAAACADADCDDDDDDDDDTALPRASVTFVATTPTARSLQLIGLRDRAACRRFFRPPRSA